MLFTLTSLTNFPSTPAKHCCLFGLFASTVELKTWECRDGVGVDGAIMAVRHGTGRFKPELPRAGVLQQSTLNTMTPPCAIRCVCTHATICAALPECAQACFYPLPLQPGGERVPQHPS